VAWRGNALDDPDKAAAVIDRVTGWAEQEVAP
jgi:hypothetical protein